MADAGLPAGSQPLLPHQDPDASQPRIHVLQVPERKGSDPRGRALQLPVFLSVLAGTIGLLGFLGTYVYSTKSETAEVRREGQTVSADVLVVKEQIAHVKESVGELKTEQKELDAKLDVVDENLRRLLRSRRISPEPRPTE